jgi:hypothetical protein
MSTQRRTRSSGHDVPSPHWAAAEPGFGFEILDRDEEVEVNGGDEDVSEGASDTSHRVQVETVDDSEAQDDEDARGGRIQGRNEECSASDTDDGLSDGSSLGGAVGDSSPNLSQLVQLTLATCCISLGGGKAKVICACGGSRDLVSKSYCKRDIDKRRSAGAVHHPGWYQAMIKGNGSFTPHGRLDQKIWTPNEIQQHESSAREEMARAASAFDEEDDDHSASQVESVGQRVSFGRTVSTPPNHPTTLHHTASAGSAASSFHTATGDTPTDIREKIRDLLQQELGTHLRGASLLSSRPSQSDGRHSAPESTDIRRSTPEAMPKFSRRTPPPVDTAPPPPTRERMQLKVAQSKPPL